MTFLWLWLLFLSATQAVPPDILRLARVHLDFSNGLNLTSPAETQLLMGLAGKVVNQSVGVLEEAAEKFLEQWNVTEDSKRCLTHMAALFKSVAGCAVSQSGQGSCDEETPLYLIKMIDSWPKLPSGILRRGPFFLLGDYDQCLELQPVQDVHYCTLSADIALSRQLPLNGGLCLPRECSEAAILELAGKLLDELIPTNQPARLKGVYCQSKENATSWTRLSLYVCLCLLCCLLVAGTWTNYKMRRQAGEDMSFDLSMEIEPDRDDMSVEGHEELEERPLKPTTCPPLYNAPSIALTFRSVPDIKKTLSHRSTLVDLLCAFSIRVSLMQLFRNSAREVPVLHGIKVFSAIWVILGHSCLFSLPYMDTVLSLSSSSVSPWLSSLLFNSSLAVDSFLLVTGTVLAYTVRKRMLFRGGDDSPTTTAARLLLFYLHRVSRLWPALLLFTAFVGFFYSTLGDGPLWNGRDGIFGAQCGLREVAMHLLFVSNMAPSTCLPWLWHISLDFQLYLVSPLFLFFLSKQSSRLCFGAALIILLSLVYRTLIFLLYNLPANMFLGMLKEGRFEEAELHFKLLYASPISRCPPFVVGILTGWFLCVQQKKQSLSWLVVWGLKLSGCALLGYALFAPLSETGAASIFHAVLHRTFWSVGLAVLIWLSESGQAPLLHFILASPRLLPVSRLSFGIYLTHEPILLWLIWTQREAVSAASFGHFVLLTATVTALSLLAAFAFAICFELPMLSIERRLFKKTDCRFNRNKERTPRLQRVQKRLGREATALLTFTEKTSLWLTNVNNPYELMTGGTVPDEREEGEIETISSLTEEHLLETGATEYGRLFLV